MFADEDVVEAVVGAAFVPIEEYAVLGVVVDPEVAEGGFAAAGLEATDGCFVDFEVAGLSQAGGDVFVEGKEAIG